jgi:hypothetical protein
MLAYRAVRAEENAAEEMHPFGEDNCPKCGKTVWPTNVRDGEVRYDCSGVGRDGKAVHAPHDWSQVAPGRLF